MDKERFEILLIYIRHHWIQEKLYAAMYSTSDYARMKFRYHRLQRNSFESTAIEEMLKEVSVIEMLES